MKHGIKNYKCRLMWPKCRWGSLKGRFRKLIGRFSESAETLNMNTKKEVSVKKPLFVIRAGFKPATF